MSIIKKLTKEQWKYIDEPVSTRMNCECKPICKECLHSMWESHLRHSRSISNNRRKSEIERAPKDRSASLMWYEVTYTYPDRDKLRAKRSITKLKRYSDYNYIDGRFEIGKKNGLYHMHFLIKTHKYLRLREIKKINDNKVSHLSRLKGIDGLKFQHYIEKDKDEVRPTGWDFNFSE